MARHICLLILLSAIGVSTHAQPFLDILNVRYQVSPNAGVLGKGAIKNNLRYINISTNIPYQFKDSSVLVFSPFVDEWNIEVDGNGQFPTRVRSLAFPLSFIKQLNPKTQITLTAIGRFNGHHTNISTRNFQAGGAVLVSQRKSETLVIKYGLYFNNEFSGPFFMPLVGVDWKLNDRVNIFGVLPGNLVLERKVNKAVYYGALFRAITNTYHIAAPSYARIDENQLAAWFDLYLSKNIVFNVEAGHSVFRRIRLGVENSNPRYYYRENMNDGILLKASMAYRVRFR